MQQTIVAQSSSSSCSSAVGVCSGSAYSFPAGVNAGTAAPGPNYGCLRTQPNPAWFFLQMQNSGSITFTMSSNPARDIDYIIWGPFSNPFTACGVALDTTKIVSCSYSLATTETGTIPSGVTGEYYVVLITNYSNRVTNISFAQTGGTGSSNCDILCNINSITATASSCGTGADLGTYTVTGTVNSFSPPSGGILTVRSSCGDSITFSPPFATSINFSLPKRGGLGDSCTITASFSSVSTCTRSIKIATPQCCSINAPTTATACQGQPLTLTASGTGGGTYTWSGPAGFTSNQQNPILSQATTANAGNYSVYLTYGGCITPPKPVTVTVNGKPTSKSISHR